MTDPKSKIIVDDDWKSRVEAEKESLKKPNEPEHSDPEHSDPGDQRMPPASFPVLVSTLATQSLVALGQLPDPFTEKPTINLEVAKHFVDTLAMLEEKTKGNLTEEEKTMIGDVVHQLRMAYISVRDSAGTAPTKPKSSSIELP